MSLRRQKKEHKKEQIRKVTELNNSDNVLIRNYTISRNKLLKDFRVVFNRLETDDDNIIIENRQFNRSISKLNTKIDKEIEILYNQNNKEIQDNQNEVIQTAFMFPFYLTETELKIILGFEATKIIIGVSDIQKLSNKWKKVLKKALKEAALRSFTGEKGAINKLTKNYGNNLIKKIGKNLFEGDINNSLRINRNEYFNNYNKSRNEGQFDIIKKDVNIKRIWDAILDSVTRADHRAAHGQIARGSRGLFRVGGFTVDRPKNFGIAAQDINCRCDVIEEIDNDQETAFTIVNNKITNSSNFRKWIENTGDNG